MTADIDSARIILWLDLSAQALDAARAELSELDGAVGDGDHGRSMAEGMTAAAAAIRNRGDAAPAELFRDAGTAFLGRVGATVGPLYASAFFRCGGAEPTVPAQPVALAPDGDDVAVVEHPVEDRGGHNSVAEDASPFADGPVRGDEQRAALLAAADPLEEQMRRVRFEIVNYCWRKRSHALRQGARSTPVVAR